MFSLKCDSCDCELTEPGALVFSPPTGLLSVWSKFHLCVSCWSEHFVIFDENGWTVEHPFQCRLSGHMAECLYTKAMQHRSPNLHGRYPITFPNGEILFGGRTDVG